MSGMYKSLTVIIPAYNVESLLGKCVESLAVQDYPKELFEIIVVDDGSTDNTLEVAQKLSDEYSNVKVIHKENGGSSSARNVGIEAARGEYIGFVDSDDFVDCKMFTTLMQAALINNADMVQTSRDEIDEKGNKLPDVVIPPKGVEIISPKEQMKRLLLHVGDASFCTRITRKEVFEQGFRFPEGELNEDFYLMIHILKYINKLVILPQQYYHVFYRLGSNSRKNKEDKDYFPSVFTDIVRNADVALKLVKKDYPDLEIIAERFGFVQRLDYLLHIPVSKMTADNRFYIDVVKNIRSNLLKALFNRYLTLKQKLYLCILAPAPRFIRKAHALVRGL